MSKKTSLTLLIATLILAGLFASYTMRKSLSSPMFAVTPTPATSAPISASELSTFASEAYQFGLAFPKKYFISARELDASSTPNLQVVLLLDTKENRDLLLGKSTTPRDGTTGITLNVHKNSKKLSPTEWAKTDSNWNVSDKKITETVVSGNAGVLFRWSGLYEGASFVTAQGEFMYVFAVSWDNPKDPIIQDFDLVLSTVRYGLGAVYK